MIVGVKSTSPITLEFQLELTDAQLDQLLDRLEERRAAREPAPERWLATNDAAGYLGCHPATLRRKAAAREIDFAQEGPRCKMYFSTRVLDAHRRGEKVGSNGSADVEWPHTSSGPAVQTHPGPGPRKT